MMGCCKVILYLTGLKLAFIVSVILILNSELFADFMRPDKPEIKSQWWGPTPTRPKKEDTTIKKFQINVSDSSLKDLMTRLAASRFVDQMPNINFQYGFNSKYLEKVVKYWQTNYNWRTWEKKLNNFDQFTTEIEGLRIHYIHAKPTLEKGEQSTPVMLIHGWPGSIVEFYKVIPLLTAAGFEVIAPSLPGYGWSQAAPRPGLDCSETARLMVLLMSRLGFDQRRYYVQGGDWGSMVATNMAKMKPELVRGLHVNMMVDPFGDLRYWFRLGVGAWFPSLVLAPEDAARVYPYGEKMLKLLDFSGYFHLQATRPDTIGASLIDSPVGLAAYILEKFSGWTIVNHKALPDGGLETAFTLDEVITNLMVYWTSNSIASSMRYYKENIELFNDPVNQAWQKQLVTVPVGAANSPQELSVSPEPWFRFLHPNLLQYTNLKKGGHFLAFQEPKLFADDVITFTQKAEAYWKKQTHVKTEL